MKIVIDIPEEKYNRIKRGKWEGNPLADYIENGAPLPETYGRLIDADEYVADVKKHYFDNTTVIRCTEIAIENAPTIIESKQGVTT